MHMRAANVFTDSASRWEASVKVSRGDMTVNGKSIMGLMMLAAPCGTEIEISIEGPDEEAALEELVELVRNGFGEELAEEKGE
jgi:phosphocarrier protein